jgi:hypothetical protein
MGIGQDGFHSVRANQHGMRHGSDASKYRCICRHTGNPAAGKQLELAAWQEEAPLLTVWVGVAWGWSTVRVGARRGRPVRWRLRVARRWSTIPRRRTCKAQTREHVVGWQQKRCTLQQGYKADPTTAPLVFNDNYQRTARQTQMSNRTCRCTGPPGTADSQHPAAGRASCAGCCRPLMPQHMHCLLTIWIKRWRCPVGWWCAVLLRRVGCIARRGWPVAWRCTRRWRAMHQRRNTCNVQPCVCSIV